MGGDVRIFLIKFFLTFFSCILKKWKNQM
jgi:hypothetical protein